MAARAMLFDLASESQMRMETMTQEDLETASIRSAAPSYVSEAPSYHSTAPANDSHEPTPPYSPPASVLGTMSGTTNSTTAGSRPQQRLGLRPVPPGPLRSISDPMDPSLLRIPLFSSMSLSANARHYNNVVRRRISRAAAELYAPQQRDSANFMLRSLLAKEERSQQQQNNRRVKSGSRS